MTIEMIPLISFAVLTIFTPGPNNISSASMGMLCGYRKTVHYLLGISSGFFLVMMACAYLSSALLGLMPFAERYLRWAGATYILWLAMGALRADYALSESGHVAGAFTKGFFLQIVNPKGALYGITVYSTFLASISGQPGYLLLSAAVFAATSFVAISTWALSGAAIKQKLKNDSFKKIINISLAMLLVYTAMEISGIL